MRWKVPKRTRKIHKIKGSEHLNLSASTLTLDLECSLKLNIRRALAVLVVVAAVALGLWAVTIVDAGSFWVEFNSSAYPNVPTTAFSHLSKAQTAKAASTAIANCRRLVRASRAIQASDREVTWTLALAVAFLGLVCGALLWRSGITLRKGRD